MKSFNIGESTLGQSIQVLSSTDNLKNKKVLVMSGLHGDEIEGVVLTSLIVNNFRGSNFDVMKNIVFAPIVNPDGFALNQRWNINNVDLNRNWRTKDWSPKIINPRYPPGSSAESERETQVLRKFIANTNIEFVVDLHSYKDSVLLPLYYRETDSMKANLNILSKDLNIPIEYEQDNLGYSISGGFHTWCFENKIQNLTIEVEKGLGQFAIKERYLEAMINFIKETA